VRIYKTATYIYSEGEPVVKLIDTIEHEGKFWLVPDWIEKPLEGWKSPERIILLDVLPHQKVPPGSPIPADFVLGYPRPTASFANGQTPIQSTAEPVVIESPDIRVPIPKGIH
jgi:hypothetical protein